ncbi:transcriptional repressor LexA [Rhodanobacter sp. B2A1Ga4]|jgi:SOS regulatory protein LexA|uniref:transcriptional repressor LexA n=1 Tax=Rhodanobacter sp. B2A1Ga4 TaxID=2778647 RepID=UPI001B361DA5|nr:transcriptional repressor LexA [Rhodanobacter sp. B2A1Ga4]MBQ4855750.1 transcriptional repressor LexA [Rhodanobacter sp. B2A1Ga4]
MTLQLTDRQQEILAAVRAGLAAGGAPTLEELCATVGIRQPSAVLKHLRSLAAKGYLVLEPSRHRGIRLAQPAEPLPGPVLALPLVGRVAAGEPITAETNTERTVHVSADLFRLKPDYLLRVHGDSMLEEGIFDGDLVGVYATPSARHGEIVVARVGGDAFTIKRLHHRGGSIRLLPANARYAPIDPDPTEDFAIEGLFAGLIRGA